MTAILIAVTFIMIFVSTIRCKAFLTRCQPNEEEKMPEDSRTYKEMVTLFTQCYDTTNPLTEKEGRIRMLKAAIERAGDDTEEVEALKAQQQAVKS
jgi:flagellar basal body-associated protein FliL